MTKSYLEFLELLGRIWLNIAMMWRKKNMRLDLFTFMLRRTKKGKTNDSNVSNKNIVTVYLFTRHHHGHKGLIEWDKMSLI